jgi:hypothetical protein
MAAGLIALAISHPSFGCTREAPVQPVDPPSQEELASRLAAQHAQIFVARLTHKVPLITVESPTSAQPGIVFIFNVSKGWNSSIEQSTVRLDWPPSLCGYKGAYPLGREYLVFRNPDNFRIYVLPENSEMVSALGRPQYTVRNGFVRRMHN